MVPTLRRDQSSKRSANPAAADGWEAREGRSDEKKGANQRFMEIVADMWDLDSLFVVSGMPGASPVGRGWARGAGHRIRMRRTKKGFGGRD
jgi:hypothetical protein